MTLSTDRLIARIAELEARLQETEAASSAKDEFIAALSRELSNPQAPILLAVERLRAIIGAGDPARTETAMLLVERAVNAFDRRTRVLLGLADLIAGAEPLPPAMIDVSVSLASAAQRHAETARRAGCVLDLDIAPGLWAFAHEEPLAQVMDCLLANAFRFGAGRPVELRAAAAQEAITVTVTDHGPGLQPEEQARVFGLFQRPRGPLEPGFGVGLWVSSRLVAAMGGQIWVESTPGAGAQFHLALPQADGSAVASLPETMQLRDEPAGR